MATGVLAQADPAILNLFALAMVAGILLLLLLPLYYEIKLSRSRELISRINDNLVGLLSRQDQASLICSQNYLVAANHLARKLLQLPTSAAPLPIEQLLIHFPAIYRNDLGNKLQRPYPFTCKIPATDKHEGLTIYGRPHHNAKGTQQTILQLYLDTEVVQEHNYYRLLKHLDQLKDAAVITDLNLHICAVNPQFSQITGYSQEEIIGQHISTLKSGDHDISHYEQMWAQIKTMGHWSGKLWNRTKQGEKYLQQLSISEVSNDLGDITHYLGLFSDLSRTNSLEQLSQYDAAILIPQLRLLEAAFKTRRDNQESVNFLVLDIQRFSVIQNTFGSHAAAAVVHELRQRLLNLCSEQDQLAQLGKDEFGILLGTDPLYTQNLIQAIQHHCQLPIDINGTELSLSVDIGLASSPEHGASLAELTSSATIAMRNARDRGHNKVGIYTAELKQQTAENLQLETYLRDAIPNQELSLHYQPIFDHDRQVIKVEALLRWQHPQLGAVSPGKFIPVAEQSGLILPIGDWIISEACRQHAHWKRQGFGEIDISINISSCQLQDARLVDKLMHATSMHAISRQCLTLEITESVLMEQLDIGRAVLEGLAHSGFSIAIDDFGTGYSSLAYLKEFPAEILKIDRAFVHSISTDEDTRILDSIIQLAQSLDMCIIAEGIEDSAQLIHLQKRQCDSFQGFLLARPMPAAELEQKLNRGTLRLKPFPVPSVTAFINNPALT